MKAGSEPQASREDLEKRRIEGTQETTKAEEIMAERLVLRAAEA